MDKFLETHGASKLNQEEIDNLNRLITRNEIEYEVKKNSYKQKSRTRWLQRQILTNIQRRNFTDPSQNLPKD